jgi:hypothetical protein
MVGVPEWPGASRPVGFLVVVLGFWGLCRLWSAYHVARSILLLDSKLIEADHFTQVAT